MYGGRQEIFTRTGEGYYDIEARAIRVGTNFLVCICGCEHPHIGTVAAVQSRPSLKDPYITSATTSVFCYVGHKEDALAKQAAERMAVALETKVVVTAGIHWANLPEEGIVRVLDNAKRLGESLLKKIQEMEGEM